MSNNVVYIKRSFWRLCQTSFSRSRDVDNLHVMLLFTLLLVTQVCLHFSWIAFKQNKCDYNHILRYFRMFLLRKITNAITLWVFLARSVDRIDCIAESSDYRGVVLSRLGSGRRHCYTAVQTGELYCIITRRASIHSTALFAQRQSSIIIARTYAFISNKLLR